MLSIILIYYYFAHIGTMEVNKKCTFITDSKLYFQNFQECIIFSYKLSYRTKWLQLGAIISSGTWYTACCRYTPPFPNENYGNDDDTD